MDANYFLLFNNFVCVTTVARYFQNSIKVKFVENHHH